MICSTRSFWNLAMTSDLGCMINSIEDIDWITVHVLKANKKQESILKQSGFLRVALRESTVLRQTVRSFLDVEGAFQGLALIDWTSMSKKDRNTILRGLAKLLNDLPRQFMAEVKDAIQKRSLKTAWKTHRDMALSNGKFKIDRKFVENNNELLNFISKTTSLFFREEYTKVSRRFDKKAKRFISDGIERGLSNQRIFNGLLRMFKKSASHKSYWDTVALVHVNRVRSFAQLKTFKLNGIENYKVSAVLDGRTTDICLMLHDTVMSVESGLGVFEEFRNIKTREGFNSTSPFLFSRGGQVFVKTVNGHSKVADKKANNSFDKLSAEKMSSMGINAPPYHFRCRSRIVPA